jgi:hypothetical protein
MAAEFDLEHDDLDLSGQSAPMLPTVPPTAIRVPDQSCRALPTENEAQ